MAIESKENVKLSVIIPVYNTEQYLKKCLDSVILACKKLSKNSEILVINDGSTGNTDEIMSFYLQNNQDLIKYYKKENSGIANTRNFGIENAKGQYITFVDSDDYVDENYYNDAFSIINKNDIDVIIYDIETIENDKFYRTHAKNSKIIDDKWGCIDISIMPSPCNKIMKKELFHNLKYPEGYPYEDLATTLIILLKAKSIKYVPKAYYKYTIRNNSIMHKEFDEKNFKIIDVLKILFYRIDELKDISQDDKLRAKNSVYYDRLYFELLEPLQKQEKKSKYRLAKILCKKLQKLHKSIEYNKYYKQNLFSGRKLKVFYFELVDFALYNNIPGLLCKVLDKAVYYKRQYISDEWEKLEEKDGE